MGDDGLDGPRGEGALSGFELQFGPEWIDGRPSNRELTFGFARHNTSSQQATKGRLSRVVAARDPSETASIATASGP